MRYVFLINHSNGEQSWTPGFKRNFESVPSLNGTWEAIQQERPLLCSNQRPATLENFDGIEAIFNPRYVTDIAAFPVMA